MMRKLILKNGQTLYVSDSALRGEYTADKLSELTDFNNRKPITKATNEELVHLMKVIFGKDVKPSQCKACNRHKWLTMLTNYRDIATKVLQVRDEEAIKEYEAQLGQTEDTESDKTEETKPVEKEETKSAKKGKVSKK